MRQGFVKALTIFELINKQKKQNVEIDFFKVHPFF